VFGGVAEADQTHASRRLGRTIFAGIEPAPGHPEILRIVAPNPSPLTLEGTNTYIVGPIAGAGDAVYVVDPGPADETHVAAVREAAAGRGELAGVLLTHSHADHSAAVPLLGTELLWGEVGSGDEASVESGAPAVPEGWPPPADLSPVGPFRIVPTPGHAVDHVCLLLSGACFCGDLVLGHGSSFVPPDGGSLVAYLESLRRVRELDPELLCPGHGPYVTEPRAKLDEYLEHRLERERKLVEALDDGERSRERLLARAWDDVPSELLPVAALVLQAHLEKLDFEGRLPDGLED
jgi:glyoxylase-like metal-dependent hydrolase (beta-lactamase superfamily II)